MISLGPGQTYKLCGNRFSIFLPMFPRLPIRGNCCGSKTFYPGPKNVSQRILKYFWFPGLDICFVNIVSSFAHPKNNVALLSKVSLIHSSVYTSVHRSWTFLTERFLVSPCSRNIARITTFPQQCFLVWPRTYLLEFITSLARLAVFLLGY